MPRVYPCGRLVIYIIKKRGVLIAKKSELDFLIECMRRGWAHSIWRRVLFTRKILRHGIFGKIKKLWPIFRNFFSFFSLISSFSPGSWLAMLFGSKESKKLWSVCYRMAPITFRFLGNNEVSDFEIKSRFFSTFLKVDFPAIYWCQMIKQVELSTKSLICYGSKSLK